MSYDSSIVSDLHKEAFGFRPSEGFWSRWNAATDAERQVEWDYLLEAAERSANEESQAQDRAEVAANAEIAKVRELTGGSVADAIRALHDAYDTDGDDGYLEYKLGTRYGFLSRLQGGNERNYGEVSRG